MFRRVLVVMGALLPGCHLVFALEGDATPACITDGFEEPTLQGWMAFSDPTSQASAVGQTGGKLQIQLAANTAPVNVGIRRSVLDFTGASIEIKVDDFVFQGPPGNVAQLIGVRVGEVAYQMIASAGDLTYRIDPTLGPNDQIDEDDGLDETRDRHWKLREEGGRLFFETSRDGVEWVPRHDVELLAPLVDVLVSVEGASFNTGVADPEVGTFDDFALRGDCASL